MTSDLPNLLGSSLLLLEGIIIQDKVDSFNLPRYHRSPKELARII